MAQMSHSGKRMREWNNKDVISWVQTLPDVSSAWRKQLAERLQDNGLSGKDLLTLETANDVADCFGVNRILCKRFLTAIQSVLADEKITPSQSWGAQHNEEKKKESEFEISLFARNKTITLKHKATTSTYVCDVQQWYKDETGVSFPAEDIRLYRLGRRLDPQKTLQEVGIVDERHLIYVQFKVRGGCFVNGTKVLLSTMQCANIEDVNCNDLVLTYNLDSNRAESHRVKSLLKYRVNELVTIELVNKSQITCTPLHPFYVASKQMWCCVDPSAAVSWYAGQIQLGKLCVGDQLFSASSDLVEIQDIRYKYVDADESITVRTLEVDGANHNFFANGMLVHNKGGKVGPNMEKFTNQETGDNPYYFYTVSPGFMYHGICKNEECKANNQPVTYHRGFDDSGFCPIDETFEDEDNEHEARCPGCKSMFEVLTYKLYKCDCVVKFKKKGGQKAGRKLEKKIFKPRGDKVISLGQDDDGEIDNKAEYQVLKFWVYKEGAL
eukprot:CAMPEP_0197028050 /NCGR_PEP_ID=MMETSP1384-20130603/7853_1 /TAXON_ID=29189 /ORGANISM="Ammonia sp." /LENGTH=495 /DNA_ID=CAMNT_0042456993 /DNA_START=27 /DNA_END=1514 /DNA_ORIENTATION=-